METLTVKARDGYALTAHLFIPKEGPRAVVQINAATGAKPSYYIPFAEFLVQHGFAACVWHYRETSRGSSHRKKKKWAFADRFHKEPLYFRDYGQKDMPAILEFLEGRFPGKPLIVAGHSVGGQQIGFMDNFQKISGLLAVASSVGYYGFMPWAFRLNSLYFFYVFSPLSHLLFGYNAAAKFGYMENLPTEVVREWRAWCRKREYFFDPEFAGKTVSIENFTRYNFPVHVLVANDDPIANPQAVKEYWRHIQSSRPITFEWLKPSEFNVQEIGHFGYFRRRFQGTIWMSMLSSIESFLDAHPE